MDQWCHVYGLVMSHIRTSLVLCLHELRHTHEWTTPSNQPSLIPPLHASLSISHTLSHSLSLSRLFSLAHSLDHSLSYVPFQTLLSSVRQFPLKIQPPRNPPHFYSTFLVISWYKSKLQFWKLQFWFNSNFYEEFELLDMADFGVVAFSSSSYEQEGSTRANEWERERARETYIRRGG